MRRPIWILAAPLLLACASSAEARIWGLGPNLNLGVISEDGGGSVTHVDVPATLGGLRVTVPSGSGRTAWFFDTGLSLSSTSGSHSNSFALTGNGQWNVAPTADLSPCVNAGLGLLRESVHSGSVDNGATSFTIGAGFGLRRKWGDSASVRGEIRYDRISKGKDGNVTVIDGGNEVSFRVGFDLWAK